MANSFEEEDDEESGAPSSGGAVTFADMQLAGQARPAPPGSSGTDLQFLEAIPVSGGMAPPPPLYLQPQYNMGMQTPPPPTETQPTVSNPNPSQPGSQQQQISRPTPQDRPPQTQSDSGGDAEFQQPEVQTMTNDQWTNYSPMTNLSEEDKKKYWAGQGTQSLAGMPGYKPYDNGAYNPTSNAQATQNYVNNNRADIDTITKSVQGAQQNALSAYNAGNQQINTEQAEKDRQEQWAAIVKDGGAGNYADFHLPGTAPAGSATFDRSPNTNTGASRMPGIPQSSTGVTPEGGATGGPKVINGGAPNGATGTYAPNNGSAYQQGGGPPPFTQAPFQGAGGDLSSILRDRLSNFNGGYQNPLQNEQMEMIRRMMTQPSAFDSDLFKKQYDMLKGDLNESYGLEKQNINETGARRGLYDSSNTVGRLGDASIQHDRAMSDMGTKLLLQRAQQMSGDQMNAASAANQFNASGLNNFLGNEGAMSNRVNQAMGYDNDLFNRSLSTAQFNNQQDQQQMDFWLKMLGY